MSMTSQEVFDTVAKHLFAQGAQALAAGPGSSCRYRAANGRKCAVGVLIPDAEYDPDFEGMGSLSVGGRCPSLAGVDLWLLSSLQEAHDDEDYWGTEAAMKARLASIAEEYALSPAILADLSFNRAA